MPVDQERSRFVFRKLGRQLAKLAARPAPESVHKFRTSSRRVEALLDELDAADRNSTKLLKMLARLRKKAGRVRDLDVQIGSLRNLKVPEGATHKSQLILTLTEERLRREKKLAKAFGGAAMRELHKRLKRASGEAKVLDDRAALSLALRLVAKLARDPGPLTEKMLHQYRIIGKRARYLAELAGNDPEAKRLVGQLKRMQDVIGDWHDWLKLANKAAKLFGGVRESPLVAALHNVTRAKFRHAVDALSEARAGLASKKPAAIDSVAGRRESRPDPAKGISAVA
jgi:CHAD domain-containing protein